MADPSQMSQLRLEHLRVQLEQQVAALNERRAQLRASMEADVETASQQVASQREVLDNLRCAGSSSSSSGSRSSGLWQYQRTLQIWLQAAAACHGATMSLHAADDTSSSLPCKLSKERQPGC